MAFTRLKLLQVPGNDHANAAAGTDADAVIFHQATSQAALRDVLNRESGRGEPETKKARTDTYELFLAGDHAIAVREPWTVEATMLHETNLDGWFVLQATIAHDKATSVNVFACHWVSKRTTPDPDVKPHKTALGRALWKKRRNAKAVALRALIDKVLNKDDMGNVIVVDCDDTPTSDTFEIALAPPALPVDRDSGYSDDTVSTLEQSHTATDMESANGERDTRDPMLVSSDHVNGNFLGGLCREELSTWSDHVGANDENDDMQAES